MIVEKLRNWRVKSPVLSIPHQVVDSTLAAPWPKIVVAPRYPSGENSAMGTPWLAILLNYLNCKKYKS
jgi:hypothetical protein